MIDAKPCNWVVISGIGGLGHLAVQYAKAMGLKCGSGRCGRREAGTGVAFTINAKTSDPVAKVKSEIGGAHGVLVTAVSRIAFAQAVSMVRRGGTMVLNGLPPGDFPVSIFNMVLNGIMIRGSIVGIRLDLKESIEFASAGKVKAIVKAEPLENINDIFQRMHAGTI